MTASGTILGAIARHAATRPDAPALIVGDAVLSWQALAAAIGGFADAAEAAGVGPGMHVGILCAPSPAAVAAFLGTVATGAAAVPLPLSLRSEALAALIADCAPVLMIADAAAEDVLDRPADILIRPGKGMPFAGGAARQDPYPPESAFNIIYSSGTTGQPKGIVHSRAFRNDHAARKAFDFGPDKRLLLATPLYSNTTLVPMLAALHHGATVQLMAKFDASAFLAIAEGWRATHTMLVPVQYRRLIDHDDAAWRDLTSLELMQSTSAPLAPDLKADILARWPGRLLEVYGLTEGGVSTALDARAAPTKLHTVGKPTAGVEIRILNEAGEPVAEGAIGEIVGHSPWMMTGYHGRDDLTEAIRWRAPDGRIFHRSGDLGSFDADGFLTIQGRKKEMIISGGFNIYPVDLEAALLAHPDVAEAAVVGVASREWGETPVAAVVLRPGKASPGEALLAFANARLGKMQRIRAVTVVPALPRSSIGKVLKGELAKELGGGVA